MAVHRIQGLFFVLLGLIGALDSWRITSVVRETASFDSVGPDRYLLIISILMIVLGLGLAWRPRLAGEFNIWSDVRRWPPADYLLVGIILAAFVFAIPYIGFSIASLVFFVTVYRLLGDWSWPRTLALATITTVVIWFVFVYFADMSMPKSFLGV